MWIIVAITSHILFGFVALLDKYLLSGPIKNPKFYTFLIGILSGIVGLILIPLGLVSLPETNTIFVALISGAFRMGALFVLFTALKRFEASRIIPAIGGFIPVATLLLILIFTREANLSGLNFLAFSLLVVGSVWMSIEKKLHLSKISISLSFIAALLFSLSFFLSKFVYEVQEFWSGFFWMILGGFFVALLLLLFKDTRDGIIKMLRPDKKEKKGSYVTMFLFTLNQAIGGLAFVLQSLAISLVPFGLLAFVSALEGVKYIFILILVWLLSIYFPSIIKEEITKKIVIQKILSIIIIAVGLLLLAI